MSGTARGLQFVLDLLQGTLDATGLETELGVVDLNKALGSFKLMVGDPYSFKQLCDDTASMAAIFGSATATNAVLQSERAVATLASSGVATLELSKNSAAMKTVLTTKEYFDYFLNDPDNYAHLRATVNASGSKLKRQVFTTGGTFVIPGGGLNGLCVVSISGAGASGTGVGGGTPQGGGGGGGSEIVIKTDWLTPPGANQTITIGAGGIEGGAPPTQSQFGTYTQPAVGVATLNTLGGAGGGSDSSLDVLQDITDVNFLNAVFPLCDAGTKEITVKGGDGATGSLTTNYAIGTNPLANGAYFDADQLFGRGGNGGRSAGGVAGINGTANTGEGATGSDTNTAGAPGNGGSGIIIVYYLEN